MGELKIFTCVDHDAIMPTGVASIIIAYDKEQAKNLLDKELHNKGLSTYEQQPYTLQDLEIGEPYAVILCDGDY